VPRIIVGLMVCFVAAGCQAVTVPSAPVSQGYPLEIRQSPSPFHEVMAGPVRALVPDAWRAVPAGGVGDPQEGFIARPRPGAWEDGRLREGMAALWVDGAKVGVPSDYYYLAAASQALDLFTDHARCDRTRLNVIVNHLPAYADGPPDSPGDYVARAQGTCSTRPEPSRWAYFVAAPGYGPARRVGIPSSGLYVVVAVMPDGPRTPAVLSKLLLRTEFAGATMRDLIAAARSAQAPAGPLR
jgi:hypothetical protein